MNIALCGGVRPDLDDGSVGSDACQSERCRNIRVCRKSGGGLSRRAAKDAAVLGDRVQVDRRLSQHTVRRPVPPAAF